MNLPKEDISTQLQDSLAKIALQQSEEIISQVKPILLNNLAHKRLDYFLEVNPKQLDIYIQIVINNYALWHDYLFAVQIDRDFTVWQPLLIKLIRFSYQYLVRKNFDTSINTHEIAEECAIKAAEAILTAQFPYDISFDAWIRRIVQLKCLKFMSEELQKRKIPLEMQVVLDEETENMLETPDMLRTLQEEELRTAINEALDQIPEARREVIKLKYFEDLSPEAIAQRLGKSIDAIYCLQFNALKDLRKICRKTGISFNE
jgi:RNA polymerase sigma factor (sigma-70 family)